MGSPTDGLLKSIMRWYRRRINKHDENQRCAPEPRRRSPVIRSRNTAKWPHPRWWLRHNKWQPKVHLKNVSTTPTKCRIPRNGFDNEAVDDVLKERSSVRETRTVNLPSSSAVAVPKLKWSENLCLNRLLLLESTWAVSK